MAEVNSYEELRRKQVEENKRKLEEFGLHHLSAAVREASAKPKPVKRKAPPRDIADLGPPRRSGRIATLPEQPDYRDNVTLGTVKSQKQKEVKPDHAYAISKAEELQDELGSDHPTFVKPMTQSLSPLCSSAWSISRTVTRDLLWWTRRRRSFASSTVHTVAASMQGGEISPRTMSSLMAIVWCFSWSRRNCSRSTYSGQVPTMIVIIVMIVTINESSVRWDGDSDLP
ncbi:B3 domain-containing protein Os06g0194400-like isoform X2 [Lolium rigidum]|uniref:B3 domain-containing protein Os06g0194400-like isoform X2 n=1 Tax=Lolium rigidum TaxID=89674 RepID=UPI001F5D0ACA|nr:B3 domain-containing protein Os06g0194400-like isoform X2 [Lolium rigidum]